MIRSKLPEPHLGALLTGALRDDGAFREWMIRRIANGHTSWGRKPLHLMYVRDDHPESLLGRRRVDIWAAFSDDPIRSTTTHLLLAELKILAEFGVGQPEDYRLLCGMCCQPPHSLARHAVTMLIAPNRYLSAVGSADGDCFQVKIALEDIKAFFDDPAEGLEEAALDRYVRYRSIIAQALNDAAQGYVPLGNELREQQFRWYRRYVSEYRPHLLVHERKGSDQSYDIQLDLPLRGFGYIKHRILEGKVVIELLRWGPRLEAVRKFVSFVGGRQVVVEHPPHGRSGNKSLHVRFADAVVPRLSKFRNFEEQRVAVRAGVDSADDLWQWCKTNQERIEEWLEGSEAGQIGSAV